MQSEDIFLAIVFISLSSFDVICFQYKDCDVIIMAHTKTAGSQTTTYDPGDFVIKLVNNMN